MVGLSIVGPPFNTSIANLENSCVSAKFAPLTEERNDAEKAKAASGRRWGGIEIAIGQQKATLSKALLTLKRADFYTDQLPVGRSTSFLRRERQILSFLER